MGLLRFLALSYYIRICIHGINFPRNGQIPYYTPINNRGRYRLRSSLDNLLPLLVYTICIWNPSYIQNHLHFFGREVVWAAVYCLHSTKQKPYYPMNWVYMGTLYTFKWVRRGWMASCNCVVQLKEQIFVSNQWTRFRNGNQNWITSTIQSNICSQSKTIEKSTHIINSFPDPKNWSLL